MIYFNELSLAFTPKPKLVSVWVLILQVIVKVKQSKENNRPHFLREERMTYSTNFNFYLNGNLQKLFYYEASTLPSQ